MEVLGDKEVGFGGMSLLTWEIGGCTLGRAWGEVPAADSRR